MIAGIFHQGSGIGNQLHRYVATRVLAADKGYEWGMAFPEHFKAINFMPIDMGKPVEMGDWKTFQEKKVTQDDVDIRGYDPEFNFIEDNTVIDGEFQDQRYFIHRLDDIRKWLAVEPYASMPDDLCIIGFRGGEYTVYPDLFLKKEYWDTAVAMMKKINPRMRFEVHTDDWETAKAFFPDYHVIHDPAINWRSVRYAKHLIIANSSFYILPALLNEDVKEVIAPRYWARRNIGVWALPQNYYDKFTYI